ncbi:MAG: glutamyl-tRNA reductase [Elusimicrobia bacterium]|nr:glutamyl-tRNA reductase [Candidatus Obscuribacterium magneticum]
MGLVVIGLSHKTAPVELREHLAVPTSRLEEILNEIKSLEGVKETVVLSTCNRFEIYARPIADRNQLLESIGRYFTRLFPQANSEKVLYRHQGPDAVLHLFRVVAGLDSLVIGETEILGQVKSAYLTAQGLGVTGKITNVVFQRALFVGKQIRTKTDIARGASSVGSVAVQLAGRIFEKLRDHRVLLLGAGEIAEATARHLLSQKVGQFVILNRTLSKAEDLAHQFNGEARPLDCLEAELLKADIVIGSTSSDKPLITKEMVKSVMKRRRQRSLYFIDVAVPRNISPKVHDLDNVYLYNIDDLQGIVNDTFGKRKGAVMVAESMVRKRASEFADWMDGALDGREKPLSHNLVSTSPGGR